MGKKPVLFVVMEEGFLALSWDLKVDQEFARGTGPGLQAACAGCSETTASY